MTTWEDVLELGLGLPEAQQSTYYAKPTLKVGGKMFVSFRDGEDVIVCRIEAQEKDFLIRSAPETYFVTPHFDGHPDYVLARLSRLDGDELRELLTEAYLYVAPPALAAAVLRAESTG